MAEIDFYRRIGSEFAKFFFDVKFGFGGVFLHTV